MAFQAPTLRPRCTRGLLVLALAAVCAAGCNRGRAGAQTPDAEPLRLRIGTALPPAGLPNTGVGELVRGLYGETLLGSDRNGSARARLCDKWEWLGNNTILKLTLRTGVSFHDGTPLDAETAATLLRKIFAD